MHSTAHCSTSLLIQADDLPWSFTGFGKSPFLIASYTLLRDLPQMLSTSFSLMNRTSAQLPDARRSTVTLVAW
jgi:hypothetical protein